MLKKILYFFLFLGIVFTGVTAYSFWQYNLPLVNPLSFIETYIAPQKQTGRVVYGFFPYWNLKYADKLHINELTHFAYFAIDLNKDGSINKKVNNKELEPGWNKLRSNELKKILYQIKLLNQRSVITVTAMDTDLIESIIQNDSNRENAINSILDIYRSENYDGINIDFEYVGLPDETTRKLFTSFVNSIKNRCMVINTNCQIDIDVFADSGRKPRLQNLKDLSTVADHIIVMTYDYYRKTSTQAGPVAPLRGACTDQITTNCLEQDINTNISEITKLVPSNKIILGIPFYGYEWQTVNTDFLSNTYSKTGSLASYQRIMSIFGDPKVSSVSAHWSSSTLSPYLSYVEDNNIYQIQFEDPRSLEMKLNLVKSAGLGGIAIWAIGYEVPYLDIWQPISDYVLGQ